LIGALVLGLVLPLSGGAGCEEELPQVQQRGIPGGAKGVDKKGSRRSGAAEQPEETKAAAVAERPRPILTRDDFHPELTRDPFQSFLGTQVVELRPERPRAQRDVKLGDYNFEDLKLIAIVHSGRNVVPRALFLATDGRSKTIKQGEYFSRAEVLLAAVNRDYVEVEVVDEDLAGGLNLTRGERRALYLKTE
jgi:Tfp pilus assembly protein PilP